MPPSDAKSCREKAAQLVEIAASAKDEDTRQLLLKVAQQWEDMAKATQEREPKTEPRS